MDAYNDGRRGASVLHRCRWLFPVLRTNLLEPDVAESFLVQHLESGRPRFMAGWRKLLRLHVKARPKGVSQNREESHL